MTLDPAAVIAIQGGTRAVVYGAAALVVGSAVFETVVLPRAALLSPDARGAARARARAIGYLAAACAVLRYVARLYIQVIDSFLVVVPTAEMLRQLIFSTRAWGLGVLAQLIVSAGVLGLLTYVRVTRTRQSGAVAATAYSWRPSAFRSPAMPSRMRGPRRQACRPDMSSPSAPGSGP